MTSFTTLPEESHQNKPNPIKLKISIIELGNMLKTKLGIRVYILLKYSTMNNTQDHIYLYDVNMMIASMHQKY